MNILIDDEVILLARSLEGSLKNIGVKLQETVDFIDDCQYKNYARARSGDHFITPLFLEGIYNKEDIQRYEEKFQRELKQ